MLDALMMRVRCREQPPRQRHRIQAETPAMFTGASAKDMRGTLPVYALRATCRDIPRAVAAHAYGVDHITYRVRSMPARQRRYATGKI